MTLGRKNWAYISCVAVVLMFSFRYRIGTDSVSYQYFFEKLLPSLGNLNIGTLTQDFVYEPGFVIFSSIIKTIFGDWLFFQIITSCMINGTIFYFLYKRTPYFFLSALLYFVLSSFSLTCESIRQSLAMVLFLWSIPYLENNKYIKYYLLLTIAFTFHYSSVILWLLPLLKWCKVNIWYSYAFLMFLFLAGGAIRSQFGDMVELIGGYYAGFERAGTTYGEGSRYMNDVINLNAALMSLFRILTYIVVSYSLRKSQRLIQYNYLLFIFLCWQMLSINLGIFYRFASYFSIFGILYLTDGLLLSYKSAKPKNVLATGMAVLAVGIMIRHNLQIEVFEGARQVECYYPYNSVFEKEEMPRREAIYNSLP